MWQTMAKRARISFANIPNVGKAIFVAFAKPSGNEMVSDRIRTSTNKALKDLTIRNGKLWKVSWVYFILILIFRLLIEIFDGVAYIKNWFINFVIQMSFLR